MRRLESRAYPGLVIQHGEILYERYFNGAARNTMLTSFSVAKSFDSALVGIAIDEGFIGDAADSAVADSPLADYAVEGDERWNTTFTT